jgi:hypothetical protein
MSALQSASGTNRTCIITMVHGTWAGVQPSSWCHALYRAALAWWRAARALFGATPPAPPWYDERSVFRSRLESKLRKQNIAATSRIFRWSGANSVVHRARAADELKSLLASDPDHANSIVIAYSHGGNVALRAISEAGSRGASIHLVTLSTPFLRVFPTWLEYDLLFSVVTFFVAIGFGVFLLARAAGVPEWLQKALLPLGPSDWWDPLHFDLFWAVIGSPIYVLVGALSYLLVRLFMNPSPRPDKRQLVRRAKTWASRPHEIADLANYDSAGPLTPSMLVIRGVDDEAALALAFGSIASAMSRLAARVITKWMLLLYMLPHLLYFIFPKPLQPLMQGAYFILSALIFSPADSRPVQRHILRDRISDWGRPLRNCARFDPGFDSSPNCHPENAAPFIAAQQETPHPHIKPFEHAPQDLQLSPVRSRNCQMDQ